MKDTNKLSSIKKAFSILNQLSEAPYEYKASDLANILGINRSTVHRILDVLIEENSVIKDNLSKKYRLGPSLYKIGSVYLHNFNFENKIVGILNKISQETKESVGLAIRDTQKIISLYEIEQFQPLKMNYRPGVFYPINRGCYGKCLMAYYDQDRVKELLYGQSFEKICENTLVSPEEILAEYAKIRSQGYVESNEETFKYAIGVGIPIFNSNGKVTTCVAVSFFKDENYIEKMQNFRQILFNYADEISKYMP